MPRAAQQLLRTARAYGLEVELPACAECGEQRMLVQTSPSGTRLCARCTRMLYSARCDGCSRDLPVARNIDGRRYCANCWRRDMRSKRVCGGCGQQRNTHSVIDGRPYCDACVSRPLIRCYVCKLERPLYSRRVGLGACESCYKSATRYMKRCGFCGAKAVIGYAHEGELSCAQCASSPPYFDCETCGKERTSCGRLCPSCESLEVVNALFDAAKSEEARRQLNPLRRFLCSAEVGEDRIIRWTRRSVGAEMLRKMLDGEMPITHSALAASEHPSAAIVLRNLLESTGCIEEIDDRWSAFECWVDQLIIECPSGSREHLSVFARWVVPATSPGLVEDSAGLSSS